MKGDIKIKLPKINLPNDGSVAKFIQPPSNKQIVDPNEMHRLTPVVHKPKFNRIRSFIKTKLG